MTAFFATTAKGMEPLVAGELRALGADTVDERRAGCAFEGSLATAYRVCLWSRVANRVLLPIARFVVPDENALYESVRTIRWRDHLGARETLAVEFTAAAEAAISHTHYGALKTKDAIVDQLRDELGERPSVDTARPDVRVNVHLVGEDCTVSIDLSGDSLHRRGYREPGAPAPLKENLAAALLLYAGWPERALAGESLVDPMCGSGTIPIEAALIAFDRAPGLARTHWGFSGWRGHDHAAWRALADEAEARAAAAAERRITIRGFDVDGRAIHAALGNLERAGLAGRIHVERRPLETLEPPTETRGIVLANPPYGERLGEAAELGPLYQELGDILRRKFPGWTGFVFTGNPDLEKCIGLRAARRHALWNGPIECRLLEYPISVEPAKELPRWRRPRTPDAAVEMFKNRVTKNLRHLRKWARREDVTCFRVYDADLVEYAVAIDLYEDALHVQEYAPPATVDAAVAEGRLADLVASLPEVTGVRAEDIFVKQRRRQRPIDQYRRLDESGALREVREGGHRFLVNLRDYLDTGLFLDHRRLRTMIGELSRGRRFLNLFAYTSTATVHAARGGALSTVSVDLSNTYLAWAEKNLQLNGVRGAAHRLERADCSEWLAAERGRYGLIFVAPPTFSNSKMAETFDVQRDHVALLRAAAALLEPDGVLLFSNHFRRFKMDTDALAGLRVENLTAKTVPRDYERNPRIHNSWRITRE